MSAPLMTSVRNLQPALSLLRILLLLLLLLLVLMLLSDTARRDNDAQRSDAVP